MAKNNLFDLGTTSRGEYKRCLGKKADGSTHMFVLGRDRAQACIAVVKLLEVWHAVEARWEVKKDTERPVWDAATLEVAKAVARGKTVARVPYPKPLPGEGAVGATLGGEPLRAGDGESFLVGFRQWLYELRAMFPTMVIEPEDATLAAVVDEGLGAVRQYHEKVAAAHADKAEVIATFLGDAPLAKGPTLADALDAYGEHLKLEHRAPDGDVTEFGGVARRRVTTLKEHLDREGKLTTPLAQVGGTFLDRWLLYWQGRPPGKKTGKPVSPETVRNMGKTVRAFVRWLSAGDDFAWRRPPDWEPRRLRPKKSNEEKAAARTKRVRYTRAELVTLWEYALPVERLMIALSLNCGFGAREIETLSLGEVGFEKKLIDRTRTKTDVYGMWPLWDVTAAGLRWYLENERPESDSPFVFVHDSGRPWHALTKGRNRKQTIPSMWERLNARVAKDHPGFVELSFGKMRKTLSHSIRQRHGVEIADLYLGHGEHEIADAYTGKRFKKLLKVVRRYERRCRPVFAGVAEPFAPPDMAPNAALPRATVRRIRELRAQGYKLAKVAELAGVCVQTVRRYVPPTRSRGRSDPAP